jgi:hypothetical protein
LLDELEQLTSRAERELVALNWAALGVTLADQRRAIAALTNAVHATAALRNPQSREHVERRIKRIFAVRDNQLKRLVSFRDNVRQRLTTISKVKQARRSAGAYAQASRPLHLDSLS